MTIARTTVGALVAATLVAACNSGDSGATVTTAGPTSTTVAAPPSTAAPTTVAPDTTVETTSTVAERSFIYPDDEWEATTPEDAGFDPGALDAVAATLESANSTCMIVTRDGLVVDERYWQDGAADVPREVFSVTKSITSVLVGIADDAGALDIEQSASDFIPQWAGTAAEAVTIENLLLNDSGREWSLAIDYQQMLRSDDKNEFAIALGQPAPPGTEWAYNNSAIQTLSEVLDVAVGDSSTDFAERVLFEPLGMDDTRMTEDASGNTLTFMGAQSTCPDLARFGYLLLRDGMWDGEAVVSEAFVSAATDQPGTPLSAAYGYLFWLNHEGPIASPSTASRMDAPSTAIGQMAPDAPVDTFWAIGLGSQLVVVIPSEGIVAVRLGAAPGEGILLEREFATLLTAALVD